MLNGFMQTAAFATSVARMGVSQAEQNAARNVLNEGIKDSIKGMGKSLKEGFQESIDSIRDSFTQVRARALA